MKKALSALCGFVLAIPVVFSQTAELKGSALFGSLRARSIGPASMSGRVADLAVVNRSPHIFYVGAAGGGIWKTKNGGASFEPIFDKYPQAIGKIMIDQNRPDTVWVGTGEPWTRNSVSHGNGIYLSVNGGKDWEHKGLENSERIADIAIHPTKPSVVFVAVMGSLWKSNDERGLYKTSDFGKTWEKVLYIDENTGCTNIIIDPQEPEIMYAATWQFRRSAHFFTSGGKGSGMYKTTDGGKTWKPIRNGLPKGDLGRIAIALSPSRAGNLYATVEADTNSLYRSTDFGETWKKMNESFNTGARPFYFSLLVADPADHLKIYKPGYTLTVSRDGGKTFNTIGGATHPDHHALWVNPSNTQELLLGTDGGVYRSLDAGGSWTMFRNLPLSQFYRISVDDDKPYNVYGGLQDNGSWMGPSEKPGGVRNGDWRNVGFGDGFCTFRHPTAKHIVFSEYQGGHLMRVNLNDNSTKDIRPFPAKGEPDYRFHWNTPVALSPNNPSKMYLGAQFLFMSTDMGESWVKISPDLTTNDPLKQKQKQSGGMTRDNTTAENHCTIYTIAESPLDENIIWAGTDDGNLQVTTDGGKTWTNTTPQIQGLPKNTWCSFVEPGTTDKNTVFATFEGHTSGDFKPYIFKSTDLGKTWKPLATDDIKTFVWCIRQDTKNPDLLFAGTEWGLYISIDGGQKWLEFENGMPKVGIRDMVIHPTADALVMGTHGRGVLILDDISPLRAITSELLKSNFAFLPIKPQIIKSGGGFQDFSSAGEFVGENPSSNAKIMYYMSKRHMVGDMKMFVYDEAGKQVAELNPGKQKGINVVDWITRGKAPKAKMGTTLSGGAFMGPSLPEGKYKVKVIKGKEEFETVVELKGNPDSEYTAEERKLQQNTALRLHALTEKIGNLTNTLEYWIDETKKTVESNKIPASKANPFISKWEGFFKTLISTDKGGIFAGDEQLNEKIIELYGNVNSFPGKPSQSQLERTALFENEVKEAERVFTLMVEKELPAINSLRTKAGLEPLMKSKEPEGGQEVEGKKQFRKFMFRMGWLH